VKPYVRNLYLSAYRASVWACLGFGLFSEVGKLGGVPPKIEVFWGAGFL
jgi:hypothetical protein